MYDAYRTRKRGLSLKIFERFQSHDPPIRFLEFDPDEDIFVEADEDTIIEKISHDLRALGRKLRGTKSMPLPPNAPNVKIPLPPKRRPPTALLDIRPKVPPQAMMTESRLSAQWFGDQIPPRDLYLPRHSLPTPLPAENRSSAQWVGDQIHASSPPRNFYLPRHSFSTPLPHRQAVSTSQFRPAVSELLGRGTFINTGLYDRASVSRQLQLASAVSSARQIAFEEFTASSVLDQEWLIGGGRGAVSRQPIGTARDPIEGLLLLRSGSQALAPTPTELDLLRHRARFY
jgi:hypothetical protein